MKQRFWHRGVLLRLRVEIRNLWPQFWCGVRGHRFNKCKEGGGSIIHWCYRCKAIKLDTYNTLNPIEPFDPDMVVWWTQKWEETKANQAKWNKPAEYANAQV